MNSENSSTEEQNRHPSTSPTQKWEWIPCVYDLKSTQGELEVIQNLSPSIILNVPGNSNTAQNAQNNGENLQQQQNSNGEGIVPLTKLDIELNKDFIYSDGLGWNWHKSWNIPDIYINLDVRDPVSKEKLIPPHKLHAELFVCKAMINDINTFHLQDVGVKGQNSQEFEGVKCAFSGLKFNSTSYNYDGAKFHLVVVIYLTQSKLEQPKILDSKISPPIFVDSRKSARDTQKQKAQKLSSYIQPFNPDNLEKIFVKRESKKKQTFEELIENNLDGLSSFFSAPNIRHKVKHPLFLAFRFSSCVKLYYNKDIYKEGEDLSVLIEEIQKSLYKIFQNQKLKYNKVEVKLKPLILYIVGQQPVNKRKSSVSSNADSVSNNSIVEKLGNKNIQDFMEPIVGEQLHIITDIADLPENFVQISDIEGVKQKYLQIYSQLASDKQNFEIEMMEQQSDHNTPFLKGQQIDQVQSQMMKPLNLNSSGSNHNHNNNVINKDQQKQQQQQQTKQEEKDQNKQKRKRKQSKNNLNDEEPNMVKKSKSNVQQQDQTQISQQQQQQNSQKSFMDNMIQQMSPFQFGPTSSSTSNPLNLMQKYQEFLQQKLQQQQSTTTPTTMNKNNSGKQNEDKNAINNNQQQQQSMNNDYLQMMGNLQQQMNMYGNNGGQQQFNNGNNNSNLNMFQFMQTMMNQQQKSQQQMQLNSQNMMLNTMVNMLQQMPLGMYEQQLFSGTANNNSLFNDQQLFQMMFMFYQMQNQQQQQQQLFKKSSTSNSSGSDGQQQFNDMFSMFMQKPPSTLQQQNKNAMDIEQTVLQKFEKQKQQQQQQQQQDQKKSNSASKKESQEQQQKIKKKSIDITLIQQENKSSNQSSNNNQNIFSPQIIGDSVNKRKNSGFILSGKKAQDGMQGLKVPEHKNSISTQASNSGDNLKEINTNNNSGSKKEVFNNENDQNNLNTQQQFNQQENQQCKKSNE